MAYEVIKDVTIPKSLGEITNDAGEFVRYEHEGRSYNVGDIVRDEDISPEVLKRLQDGDEHLSQFLVPVAEDEVNSREATKEARQARSETTTLVPEHEQERVAAQDAGHEVVDHEPAVTEPKLEDNSVNRLREIAAEKDITGRSAMTKKELVDAIKAADATASSKKKSSRRKKKSDEDEGEDGSDN